MMSASLPPITLAECLAADARDTGLPRWRRRSPEAVHGLRDVDRERPRTLRSASRSGSSAHQQDADGPLDASAGDVRKPVRCLLLPPGRFVVMKLRKRPCPRGTVASARRSRTAVGRRGWRAGGGTSAVLRLSFRLRRGASTPRLDVPELASACELHGNRAAIYHKAGAICQLLHGPEGIRVNTPPTDRQVWRKCLAT